MNVDIQSKLQFYGYKVTSKGIVRKYSQKIRRWETSGQINDAGVYFYAQNVPPFKQGQNTIKDIFGSEAKQSFTPFIPAEKQIEKIFSFDDYVNTTQSKNQFLIYLKKLHKERLNSKLTTNLYDIRGVLNGSFEDATLFPYINYDNEFITAKIVKYNTNTGNRIKTGWANSWFHSDKGIKKQLGIKDKVSKSINCFFGEHLLNGNDKPVVIVEAEKTAIILSLFYPNTIFIASGGIAKLKGLDHSFLANRQVYLFPDNNAPEWFTIAENRGWWISDILENKGEKGTDAIDYLTTYKDSDHNAEVWWELHEQLWGIDNKEIDINGAEATSLNFENHKKPNANYCLPIPKDIDLAYYWDNAKGIPFKGKYFKIYENEFQVLNANVDFNRIYKTEFGWQQMNVNQFLYNLEKCFRIVKYLNSDKEYLVKDKPYLKTFSKILYNLIRHSNHSFNISYIERVMLPVWDNDINDVTRYVKSRNWVFASSEKVDRKHFAPYKHNDVKSFETHKHLKLLKPLLDKKEFIKNEEIGLHDRKRGCLFIWDLLKSYNEKVIGCKTSKNYQSKLKVSEYLNWTVKRGDFLENKIVCTRKTDSTYYSTYMRWHKNEYTFKIPPIRTIKDETGVGQNVINEYFNFKPDNDLLIDIKEIINFYIDNHQAFNFTRDKGRIEAEPLYTIEEIRGIKTKEEIVLSPEDAFGSTPDLTNSVLNVPEEIAMQQNNAFLSSWILYHNPNLTAEEKFLYRKAPMIFFTPEKQTFLYAS